MNLVEFYPNIKLALNGLSFSQEYISNGGDRPYKIKNLILLRNAIRLLENIPVLHKDVQDLLNSWIFETSRDELLITGAQQLISSKISTVSIKAVLLKDLIEDTKLIGANNLLYVRLPDFKSFDELSKYSNDLKKAIELPLTEINEEASVIGADKGSVILYVTTGTVLGVALIAKICWAAAVIRKKRAEAKIFEAHARTLELKNDSIKLMIDAQAKQLNDILESEATAIVNNQFDHNDPETIRRLELSIDTISNLIDKGGKILPMSDDSNITKSFPNYNALDLIESSIRQLSGGTNQ